MASLIKPAVSLFFFFWGGVTLALQCVIIFNLIKGEKMKNLKMKLDVEMH